MVVSFQPSETGFQSERCRRAGRKLLFRVRLNAEQVIEVGYRVAKSLRCAF